MTVTIDDSSPYTTSANCSNSALECQIFQSPVLEDRSHKITLSDLSGVYFNIDFATVEVGPKTSVQGRTMIFDDTDSSFTYANGSTVGGWTNGGLIGGFISPFHNTTHQSTTVGDTALIRFTGSPNLHLYTFFVSHFCPAVDRHFRHHLWCVSRTVCRRPDSILHSRWRCTPESRISKYSWPQRFGICSSPQFLSFPDWDDRWRRPHAPDQYHQL